MGIPCKSAQRCAERKFRRSDLRSPHQPGVAWYKVYQLQKSPFDRLLVTVFKVRLLELTTTKDGSTTKHNLRADGAIN